MKNLSNGGILLFNKNSGLTSFDSLKTIKKRFSTSKVGHTGTLDKFAQGLLLVLVGRAVKLNSLFVGIEKEYYGTIKFGEETDTLDPEGEIIAEDKLPIKEDLCLVLEKFRGDILQKPPIYSAIHIDGKRASKLARSGAAPIMKERPVRINKLDLLSYEPPLAEILVRCSAGTYIRSLARDIALAAGSRGHLCALNRTAIGPFRLTDSSDSLLPPDETLFNALSIPCFYLNERAGRDFIHGKPLSGILKEAKPEANFAGVFQEPRQDGGGELLGILENRAGKWGYNYVFA
ncbi:MAG: tRNA pseudouridine(55) synthase TruB [Treponema sp.]|nr:tRNA pseudouridine(55) synthase TruB [Treponema sp.]